MPKNLRAAEQELFTFKNRSDVKKRNHASNRQTLIDLVISAFLIFAGTAILTHMQTLVGAAITFGAGVALLIFAKRSAATKLVIERSEFLNALLSSALAAKYKFCAIVTQSDGQIVYLNSGFQATFPKMLDFPKRTLTKLYSTYGISPDKAKSITAAVKKAASKEVSVEVINDKTKKPQKIKLVIEPIARPSGFILIRGV
jgi:hypothetical protein